MIDCFSQAQGQRQGELDQKLSELEGHNPEFKIQRGLAHLLRQGFCEFEVVSPLEPAELRPRVFAQAAQTVQSQAQTELTLEAINLQGLSLRLYQASKSTLDDDLSRQLEQASQSARSLAKLHGAKAVILPRRLQLWWHERKQDRGSPGNTFEGGWD